MTFRLWRCLICSSRKFHSQAGLAINQIKDVLNIIQSFIIKLRYKFTERPRRHNILKDNWVVTFQSTHLSVWIGKEKMLEFDDSIIIGHLSKGSPANKISKVLHLWSNFVVGFWFAIYIKNLFQKFLKENINTNMNWLCHQLKTCSW